MDADEWQAHVTRQAALEIGRWLEARGGLQRPVGRLTLDDLDAMAAAAISRWIVLHSEKLQATGWPSEDPVARFLLA